MALIHEKMYQSGDLSQIDFEDYIVALTKDLISTYSINKDIRLDLKIKPIKFGIDTLIPIGLLLNEIISNTLKYAFVNTPSGTISIYLEQKELGEYELIIGDNGIGMKQGLLQKDDETLGMELIKVFVSQVDGEITHLDKKGTYYKIIFKKREKK
jgi:two-component sensor histidine kinase